MRAPTLLQVPAPAPQAATPVGIQVVGPSPDFLALQARAADLAKQLAGLEVQRNALSREIARQNGDAREALIQQRTPIDVQIAQSNAELDNIRAQIASRSRVPMDQVTQSGQVVVVPRFRSRGADPDMVIGMTFTLMLAVVIPLSIAYARRIWRGTPKSAAPQRDDLSPRFDRLEHAVDAIAIEIERISEGQRFMTKVMAERPAERPSSQGGEAARGGLGEAQPLRALGAGPAEPIPVPNRQAVRQSITPH